MAIILNYVRNVSLCGWWHNLYLKLCQKRLLLRNVSTKISCTNTTISTVWTKTAPLSIFPFAPFSTFTKTITIAIISILTGFSRGTRICYLSLWYDVYFSSIYLMSTSCVQLPTHGSTLEEKYWNVQPRITTIDKINWKL